MRRSLAYVRKDVSFKFNTELKSCIKIFELISISLKKSDKSLFLKLYLIAELSKTYGDLALDKNLMLSNSISKNFHFPN